MPGAWGQRQLVHYARIVPEAKEPAYAYLDLEVDGDKDEPYYCTTYRPLESPDKEHSYGKVGGRAARSKGHGKRARDAGYTAMPDDRGGFYRTHIFLNPGLGGACQSCGGAVEDDQPPPAPTAPLTPRRPSVTLIKWPSTKRKSSGGVGGIGGRFDSGDLGGAVGTATTPTASSAAGSHGGSATNTAPPSRQVSFNSAARPGQPQALPGTSTAGMPMSRSEPVSLANLDRDCFIIPLYAVDRFLPEGVPMPETGQLSATQPGGPGGVKVLEVADPLLSVLLHLMTPMEPLEPLLESPLASPHKHQGAVAADLIQEVSKGNGAVKGMLLTNMEKNSEFPYISYYVINSVQTDPKEFFRSLRSASLRKFDPRSLRHTASHTLDLFNEVATIARPPFEAGYPGGSAPRRPPSPSTGYIVSFYKVFEGDDGQRFEKNWLYWTGARMLYRYLPRSVGMRRITLHKSVSQGDKLYLLLVECANFLEDLSAAAVLIPALRARLCGYTGIYRAVATT